MPDHFAILAQPRRPWIDPGLLRETFHRLSATLHPDVPETGDAAQFAALNAAYTVLKEPASRLRHLLELEAPELLSAPANPGALGNLLMNLAGLRPKLQKLQARKAAGTSPLSAALLAADEAGLRQEVEGIQAAIEAEHEKALTQLQEIDGSWTSVTPPDFAALTSLYHRLSFLAKGRTQAREASFALGAA